MDAESFNSFEPLDPAEGDSPFTTVVEPKKSTAQENEHEKYRIPRYHVILWDSEDHTFEYVVQMLRELFGHSQADCKKMTQEVDQQGKVIVLTTTHEHAELKRDQIHAYGKDGDETAGSAGSMSATIEEAP